MNRAQCQGNLMHTVTDADVENPTDGKKSSATAMKSTN